MRSFEDALKYVVLQSQDIAKRNRERKDYLNSDLNAADKAEKLERIDAQIKQLEADRTAALRDLVAYPPDFLPYKPALANFWNQTPAHRSVFIMTKYPDGADPQLDLELQTVIDTVVGAVTARGYHPHLAIKKEAARQPVGERRVPHARVCPRDRHRRGQVQPEAEPERGDGVGLDAGDAPPGDLPGREGRHGGAGRCGRADPEPLRLAQPAG